MSLRFPQVPPALSTRVHIYYKVIYPPSAITTTESLNLIHIPGIVKWLLNKAVSHCDTN